MLSYAELRLIQATLAVAERDAQSSIQMERIKQVRSLMRNEERKLLLADYGYLEAKDETRHADTEPVRL